MAKQQKYDLASLVTINTDASYDPKTNTGGWGCWIKSDFFTIKRAGKFINSINDPNESEIKAVVNALKILNKNSIKFKHLVVNCDNSCVRGIINNKKVSERFRFEGNLLLHMLKDFETVKAKHINGHRKAYNARQYVNNWCDEASKKYRSQSLQNVK